MALQIGLRLLETLTSALYEDPIVFFREYVQNSVDAFIRNPITGNTQISIDIDSTNKNIHFYDNGYGIPHDDFVSEMTSIGKSKKNDYIDQIGFRGIGRLSAMPFCKQLVFTNKVQGSKTIQKYSWNGEAYNRLLSESASSDLEKSINSITVYEEELYTGNIDDHYFSVDVVCYNDEIARLIANTNFKYRLSLLLPLKYDPKFTMSKFIHEHYNDFMSTDVKKYEFDVLLNGGVLYKPYQNENILESDMVFWDLCLKSNCGGDNEKIGILWFTFNRKVSSNPTSSPRGVFVRSKNMLLGNEYAIADAVTKNNDDYVATFRELTQTLNGVYGEILLDTNSLLDNARRDWFRIDTASNQLSVILTDFLKKLKTYRYCASEAFNDKAGKQKKEKLIVAFKELTGGFDVTKFEKEFYDIEETPNNESRFIYADDDIPRYPIQIKKFYEKIIMAINDFYTQSEGDKGVESQIKLRNFLKQWLNKI